MNEYPTCCQQDCDAPAFARVFWPGQEPSLMCSEHAVRSQQFGSVIRCYIHMEPYIHDLAKRAQEARDASEA